MRNNRAITLQDLPGIEQIRDMKSKYCRYIDTKKWEKLATVMDEKIQLDFRDPEGKQLFAFDGRKEMISLTASMLQNAVTVHHVHNLEIEFLYPDTARAIWAMEDLIIFPDDASAAPFRTMHGFGHYHEELQRTPEGWIIKTLRLERLKLDYTY